jgi:hypothetical protein
MKVFRPLIQEKESSKKYDISFKKGEMNRAPNVYFITIEDIFKQFAKEHPFLIKEFIERIEILKNEILVTKKDLDDEQSFTVKRKRRKIMPL